MLGEAEFEDVPEPEGLGASGSYHSVIPAAGSIGPLAGAIDSLGGRTFRAPTAFPERLMACLRKVGPGTSLAPRSAGYEHGHHAATPDLPF